MDYFTEAKKFIERALNSDHPEVKEQHLKMADWCLAQGLKEREDQSGNNRSAG